MDSPEHLRLKLVDFGMAMVINKFVMFVAMPALAVRLLANAPLEEFNLAMLGGYFFTEIVMYGGGYLIGRYIFGADIKESALLGLALALTNHVLFVLPIAITLFGEDAATQIIAIVTLDGIIVFSGSMILMDYLATKDGTFGQTLHKIATNPPLVATVLGLFLGFAVDENFSDNRRSRGI